MPGGRSLLCVRPRGLYLSPFVFYWTCEEDGELEGEGRGSCIIRTAVWVISFIRSSSLHFLLSSPFHSRRDEINEPNNDCHTVVSPHPFRSCLYEQSIVCCLCLFVCCFVAAAEASLIDSRSIRYGTEPISNRVLNQYKTRQDKTRNGNWKWRRNTIKSNLKRVLPIKRGKWTSFITRINGRVNSFFLLNWSKSESNSINLNQLSHGRILI